MGGARAQVRKVDARYAIEVARLNLPGLNVAIAGLYSEEQTMIWNGVDRARITAIQRKYQPEVQNLQRQIKQRNAQIAQLRRQWNGENAKITAACSSMIAKLDALPPANQLEDTLKMLVREERIAIRKLIDAATLARATEAFQTKIAELTQKLDGKRALTRKLTKKMNSQIATINGLADKRIAKVDVKENPLDTRLQRVLAKQQIELDGNTDATAQNRIRDKYRPAIDNLNEAIQTRDTEKAAINTERTTDITAIRKKYAEAIAGIDVPDETLEVKLRAARADEYAAMLSLLTAQQNQAITAKYRPQIAKLEERIRVKTARIAELRGERDAKLAAVAADYGPKLAKLQSPEDRLEYKLLRVQVQQSMAIMGLLNPNRLRAIQAKYEPRIQNLMRQSIAKQRQFAFFSQRAQRDIQQSFMTFQARSAPLEVRIYQLMLHHHGQVRPRAR